MVSTASRRGETLKESSKEKDVRISNIVAAKGTSCRKTCLLPQPPASSPPLSLLACPKSAQAFTAGVTDSCQGTRVFMYAFVVLASSNRGVFSCGRRHHHHPPLLLHRYSCMSNPCNTLLHPALLLLLLFSIRSFLISLILCSHSPTTPPHPHQQAWRTPSARAWAHGAWTR